MKSLALVTLSLSLLSSALARPKPHGFKPVTTEQLLAIAPLSESCDEAPFPEECRTACQAAPLITASFNTYKIRSKGERAALLSLMAFETGDFKYNKNHFPEPGRPGQGTRNMQGANFNLLYARSIPELAEQVEAIAGDREVDALSDEEKNEVRALVLADEYDFGSAAWFLDTQCPPEIREGLEKDGLAGWEAYITTCVYTTVTPERQTSWETAVEALKD